ncbi:D-glucosaminate-6-phosphate ammonia lyase [subsurface metagenome]
MGVYERFGVKPIINVAGAMTRIGGALMEQEALEAMNEAAKGSARLDELEAAASKVIAEITHAEAGIVTAGAAAALTLGTAACITGLDVARMNRLPDTTGMANEVLMAQHQISGYDHSIRAAGAKIIDVGIPNDTTPPGEVHVATIYDFESAITEHTVAIAYACRLGSNPPLEQIIAVGKKYNIPVILDAALQVPPVENLYKFIDMGTDLVAFSGGKGIKGPQASGILCGRRDLIAAAVLQNLDMAGDTFDKWNPPPSLIPKEKLRGKPQHGVGRGMKITKEAIIGLLVALQNLSEEKFVKKTEQLRLLLEGIAARLHGVAGVEVRMTEDFPRSYPVLEIKLDESKIGRSATEVAQRLKDGDPPIYTRERYLYKGLLIIHSINLHKEIADIVGQKLYMAITS